jgi:3-hexulose-6-phosphate synthase
LIDEAARAGVPVSVAGGVNLTNIAAVIKAGAQVAVAGAAIYGAEDPAEAAKALREAMEAA